MFVKKGEHLDGSSVDVGDINEFPVHGEGTGNRRTDPGSAPGDQDAHLHKHDRYSATRSWLDAAIRPDWRGERFSRTEVGK